MLTKAQWDAMTPQAQWDYVQSLMADVEAQEARADAELERKQGNSKDGMSLKVVRERYFPNRTTEDLTGFPTLERIRSMPEEEFNRLFPSFNDEDRTT